MGKQSNIDPKWHDAIDLDIESEAVDPRSISRPHSSLLTYYILLSLTTLIGFPFVFIPLYIRFKTLRYRIDDDGVAMSWGMLFHKEIYLTYRRIQDIHVTRNIVERWMGLAKVPIQTASGTSGATMSIVGIRNPESLRDFLYERMRGAWAEDGIDSGDTEPGKDEILTLLIEIRDALKKIKPLQGKGQ